MRNATRILLTATGLLAAGNSAQAQPVQVIQAPAGQAYAIVSNAPATAVNPVTYQWYRNNSPISGATSVSYTVPAAFAYGDNVQFYRMAKAQECAGEAEKPSNTITITFTGYTMPIGGCNLIIGGTCWADYNVDDFRLFATRADMNTHFYQWNKATPYSANDPLTPAWDATTDSAATWDPANVPCPQDWRLPTRAELQQLQSSGSAWAYANERGNQIAGRFYGYASTTCSLPNNMSGCVFLPASGFRNMTNGAITSRGVYGCIWSSTQASITMGYDLYFSGTTNTPSNASEKWYGVAVRCVQ